MGDYWRTHVFRAATYAELGRAEEARVSLARLLQLKPDVADIIRGDFKKLYAVDEFIGSLIDGLRKAGLDVPDEPA